MQRQNIFVTCTFLTATLSATVYTRDAELAVHRMEIKSWKLIHGEHKSIWNSVPDNEGTDLLAVPWIDRC